jgi:hypothetical protein
VRAHRGSAAVAIVIVALLLTSNAFAGEDPAPADGTPTRFELVTMSRSWLAPGEAANLALRIEGAPPGAEVAFVAHQFIDARTDFEPALDGDGLGAPTSVVSRPLDQLQPGGPNTFVASLGIQDPAAPPDPTQLLFRRAEPAVYPVDVQLRAPDGDVLSSFVLPVTVVPPGPGNTPPVGEELRVAWVWPLVADPAVLPDGTFDPNVLADFEPDGRLGRQAQAVASASGVPLTLAPGPETLESWTGAVEGDPRLGTGLTAARAALNANQVLSSPYVPIDIPALINGGLGGQVGAEMARGTDTLSTLLERPPENRVDPRTALVRPFDNPTLTQLLGSNVDRIIVSGDSLQPVDSQFTHAQPFMLESQGASATGIATDPEITALLTGDDAPALRAQQFLAALSVVAMEQPNLARGVAVVNPNDWSAPASLLAAALAGLSGHPLLEPVNVDQFIAEVPPEDNGGAPLVRAPEPVAPGQPPVTANAFAEAQARLGAFQSLVGPADPRIARGNRALLTALASAWESPAQRQRARDELGVIYASVDDVLSQIRVPVGSTITLTAREGEIPVTFLNETDQTLRVKVRLESDKLFFPDGDEREVELPPRSTTIGINVESRASGTSALELTVTSVDEQLTIQSTRVRVRSTVVSGVGVFLTVGASLFLALWWLLHFRKRRSKERGPAVTPGLVPPVAGG